MSVNQEIKQFLESFFKSLNVNYTINEDNLEVSSFSKEVENILGKKAPCTFSFDSANPKGELVVPGSDFLRLITNYLESKGQTTLIKLDFDRDYKAEFKHYFKFQNSELQSVSKSISYKPLISFTFRTTLQYLNEKDTLINQLSFLDNQLININLDAYKQITGKKEEMPEYDLKESYEEAKYHLKKLTENRIKETSDMLSSRMQREQNRISEHYKQRESERQQKINRIKEQLSQESLPEQRMKKLLEDLSEFQNPLLIKKLADEEKFFLADEINRHALNVGNKLIATNLFYYPLFTFTLFLKSSVSVKQLVLTYDPIKDTLTPINCESCKHEIRELIVCSSNHIICSNCHNLCKSCQQVICNQCQIRQCDECARKLCKKCITKCSFCSRPLCTSHLVQDFTSEKTGCLRCLKACSVCNKYAPKDKLEYFDSGYKCSKCIRLTNLKNSFN